MTRCSKTLKITTPRPPSQQNRRVIGWLKLSIETLEHRVHTLKEFVLHLVYLDLLP